MAGHPLAAAAGYDVLRSGGNAVDAAVTMAAVLAVVRPHMNGVGGDAFALISRPETRELVGLNGSGRAGALATPGFFATRGMSEIPGSGPLSVTVPGAVSAWAAALERYGTITLAEALEPAIRYAEQGFPVSSALHEDLVESAEKLNATGHAIFALNGTPAVGTLLRNPALARTLRQISTEGPEALYGGSVGRSLADFLELEGGYLRAEDFMRHTAEWVEPISTEYLGKLVYAMPPNAQGLAQLQQMEMAEHFSLEQMGHNSAEYLHTLVEIKKLAFADRDRWVADPAFVPAPIDRLLDPGYLRERAQLVGEQAAAGYAPGLGVEAKAVGDGEGDTVYLMAVDRWGNAVSWIQSLYASFGSGLVEPTTGIVLQNRGALFTLDPGHPNVIAPHKRPFHTLTPLLITHLDGRLAMTLGTPGGDSQTQSLLQIFNNVYLFGMTPQEAVEAPRYRSYAGRRLAIESRIPPEVRAELDRRGHELHVIDGWSAMFGGVQMILVDPVSGVLRTGADPRREAYAV
ncbi:MAG TPA: gamma-glutamyltransferase, partial [Longimicrobiaceae bacterium]|nr:gamma-glutamyltransferase [Longimicrobiaceae bacterium]